MKASEHHRKSAYLNVRILGTGKYLPGKPIEASFVDNQGGFAPGTAVKKSGVAMRHFANGEQADEMAAKAAMAALSAAKLVGKDLDAIISASATPIQIIPCNATFIQRAMGLGASGIPCLDINVTCLSFLAAFDHASRLIATGQYERVLVVSSEISSLGINWNHIESASLFGDGAAAVILGKTPDTATQSPNHSLVYGSRMQTFSDHADLCAIIGGGSRLPGLAFDGTNREKYLFHMDGTQLFKQTARTLPKFIESSLIAIGAPALRDYDLVIPHQASQSGMSLIQHRLGVRDSAWMKIIEDHGNCIAASLPMALHEAIVQGRIKRGQTALFLGTGAGISYGLLSFRY